MADIGYAYLKLIDMGMKMTACQSLRNCNVRMERHPAVPNSHVLPFSDPTGHGLSLAMVTAMVSSPFLIFFFRRKSS